jgi:hypothetical protein
LSFPARWIAGGLHPASPPGWSLPASV